jgi:hypothetical protein
VNVGSRWQLIVEVVDPKAYAEHLAAAGDLDRAWDVIDEGPVEKVRASFDDEAAARTAAAEEAPPGVRYRVRRRKSARRP